MDFGTYPTGWHIEGDLPNQAAVSTGSTVIPSSQRKGRHLPHSIEKAGAYLVIDAHVLHAMQ